MAAQGAFRGAADEPEAVATAASGGAPHLSCTVTTLSAPPRDVVVLRVGGEIDLLSQPTLEAALVRLLAARPDDLVVDLSAVVFCGVRGYALLADTESVAIAQRTRYVVSGLQPRLGRIATMVWEGGGPVRYPTVARAVAALRIA